jgi:hypothetical protein
MSPLLASTGIVGGKMNLTEINGLRLYLTSERVSAQEPQSPKKLFVDLVLVYVPLRKLWVFVSVGTPHSHLLPGGAPGRAMQIVHTIRSAPPTAPTPVFAVLYPALVLPVAGVSECNIPVTQTADGNATPLGCPDSGINAAAWAFYYRLAPWLLSLGPGVTPPQLITAACKDQGLHATVPEATYAAQLAGTYYGWPQSYAQSVNTQLINGVCSGA